MTKNTIAFFISIFFAGNALAQQNAPLKTTLKRVSTEFILNASGSPSYSVYYDGKPIIRNSSMGFQLVEGGALNSNFEIISTAVRNEDSTWKPVWGEVNLIRNHYFERIIRLKEKTPNPRLINIVFRVFEDGVGFRYEFPKQAALNTFIITNELTQFNLTGDHKAFWIPGDYDTNEYRYSSTPLSKVDAWMVQKAANDIAERVVPDQFAVQTPLMLKTANGLYINIHEAALINYPAMQLHVDRENFSLQSNLVPDALDNKAYVQVPFNTPWRTILVSDKAADILSSKTILNLNEPSVVKDDSYIKPMKFVGVWWELQAGKSTWSYAVDKNAKDQNNQLIPSGKHGANTENIKRYIDFASSNGIEGVLVEGWNIGWEEWFGTWKDEVFDFVKPYPDFDVAEISRYAKSKNVRMIMHHETSGAALSYERQLDTAYKFMNKFNYTAVKTGYVGKIIPRGEHHDGQWMINHFNRVNQKAADHQVMIDVHEAVRPTGLHRTYPNFLASEAGRGNEYNAFSTGNAPDHETILPFTRLMGGPMDYTPGIFKLKGYAVGAPDRQVHTTLAKQLALYITLYSPLQMAADYPENYDAHKDAFQFIKEVPTDWDATRILEAEPGDFITIARKGKGSNNWYVGAITDENSRTASIPLSFLDPGKKYHVRIYQDAANADWNSNPEAYEIQNKNVNKNTVLKVKLAKGGGAALTIRQL